MEDKWESVRLGKYFKIKHGWAFKGKFFAKEGKYILLTPGNFNPDGGIKLKGDKEKYYAGDFPKEFLLKFGDFLVVMTDLTQDAPILGSAAFIKENDRFLHNQRLGKITDLNDTEMNRVFLYYLFSSSSVRNQIKATATGATVKHTAPDRIYNVEVNLPPLPTQHKIATILSAYDDLIENNTRRIKILEEMAAAIYRQWFVEFRFPGHERVEMLESELGLIPQGWEIVKTEQIVKRVQSGKKYNQKTVEQAGSIPVLDQGQSGIIGYHNDVPGVMASEDKPIIVFANHTCYQRIIQFPFSTIQNVLPFLPHPEKCRNIYWLHWATKDLVGLNDYKGHWPELMSKELSWPPATICEQFGEVIKPMVQLTHRLDKRNQNLRQTRDLLLPKLISGEIDVSELNIDTDEIQPKKGGTHIPDSLKDWLHSDEKILLIPIERSKLE